MEQPHQLLMRFCYFSFPSCYSLSVNTLIPKSHVSRSAASNKTFPIRHDGCLNSVSDVLSYSTKDMEERCVKLWLFVLEFVNYHECVTVAPSSAGSNNLHWQLIPSVLNLEIMASAIPAKFDVASARMVGPAPDRQMPSSP